MPRLVTARKKRKEFPGGEKIISRRMDITDPDSVQKTVAKIAQLGIVVHGVGFGVASSCEMMPLEQARTQMETNYFSVLNVNNVALPCLRENDKSLCVITSSAAGFVGISPSSPITRPTSTHLRLMWSVCVWKAKPSASKLR